MLSRTEARAFVALGVLWALVQGSLFLAFGIRHGHDTQRYFDGATALLQGQAPQGKAASYLGYVAVVAGARAVGLGDGAIIALQVLFSGLAAVAAYRIGARLFDHRTGLVAAFLFIGYLKLHPWNFFVLTDSLFISLALISVALVLRAKAWPAWLLAGFFTLWTTLLRPNAFVVPAAVAGAALVVGWQRKRFAAFTAAALGLALAAPLLLPVVSAMAARERIILYYKEGTIIPGYDQLHITPPKSAAAWPTTSEMLTSDLARVAREEPFYVLRLAAAKAASFFLTIRPYHHWWYNLLIAATLYPLYVFAFFGLRRKSRDQYGKMILLNFLAFQTLLVMITFDDWSGRFLLPVLPVAFVFAAATLAPHLPALAPAQLRARVAKAWHAITVRDAPCV